MRKIFAIVLSFALWVPNVSHALSSSTRDTTNHSNYSDALDDSISAVYPDGVPETNFLYLVGMLVGALLGVLGVVFLLLTLYAGMLWMTAAGNSDQVKKAKAILLNSVVGLLITLSAYAISQTVVSYLGTI